MPTFISLKRNLTIKTKSYSEIFQENFLQTFGLVIEQFNGNYMIKFFQVSSKAVNAKNANFEVKTSAITNQNPGSPKAHLIAYGEKHKIVGCLETVFLKPSI